MIAQVNDVLYFSSDRLTMQGFKAGEKTKTRGGLKFEAVGFGRGQHLRAGQLYAHLSANGEDFSIQIDHYFRNRLGNGGKARLTGLRIKQIITAKPQDVTVEENCGKRQIAESDLDAWYNRAFN